MRVVSLTANVGSTLRPAGPSLNPAGNSATAAQQDAAAFRPKQAFLTGISNAISSKLCSSYDSYAARVEKDARVNELRAVRDSIVRLGAHQGRELLGHLPASIRGVIRQHDDESRVTNLELAGEPGLAESLIEFEKTPAVKNVCRAQANLAELKALQVALTKHGEADLSACSKTAQVALTRSLIVASRGCKGFVNLGAALAQGVRRSGDSVAGWPEGSWPQRTADRLFQQ